MKKFSFELQTVLDLRENIEKQWEARLAEAVSQCDLVKSRMNTLKDKILISRGGEHRVGDLFQIDLYEARLKWQIEQEEKVLKEKEAFRDEVQKEYIKHSANRKVLEKIKEKKEKAYRKMKLKDEIQFIDELNNTSRLRGKIIGGKS